MSWMKSWMTYEPAQCQCGAPLPVPRHNSKKHCSERCYKLAKQCLQNARRKVERERHLERIGR